MNGHGLYAKSFKILYHSGLLQQKRLAEQDLVYGFFICVELFFKLCFMMNVCVNTVWFLVWFFLTASSRGNHQTLSNTAEKCTLYQICEWYFCCSL